MCWYQWNNIKWSSSQKWRTPRVSVRAPSLPIHISNLNYEIADSTVSYFADDSRILLGIKGEEDTQMLHNDLHKLYKWQIQIIQFQQVWNTATFILHIRNIVKKARDKMGWVLIVFQSRERSLMLTLLKSLVIPLLELWNPWEAKSIQTIEAIQLTFIYKITEVQHLNYWERLHKLKLYSL